MSDENLDLSAGYDDGYPDSWPDVKERLQLRTGTCVRSIA